MNEWRSELKLNFSSQLINYLKIKIKIKKNKKKIQFLTNNNQNKPKPKPKFRMCFSHVLMKSHLIDKHMHGNLTFFLNSTLFVVCLWFVVVVLSHPPPPVFLFFPSPEHKHHTLCFFD